MLILLYSACGLSLGFIVGYWYGFDTHAMQTHGKRLNTWNWIRKRLIDG